MKNKFTGILGSAIGCAVAQVIVNVIAYGSVVLSDAVLLSRPAIVGAVIGTVVGCIVSFAGAHRPVFSGMMTTVVIYAILLAALFALGGGVIDSAFSLLMVAVTVLFIGVATGFGYRVLGPSVTSTRID